MRILKVCVGDVIVSDIATVPCLSFGHRDHIWIGRFTRPLCPHVTGTVASTHPLVFRGHLKMAQEIHVRPAESTKKRITAGLLLWLGLVGINGIHRFYVGKSFTGLLMLVTLGGLYIWTLLDFITILAGQFTDSLKLPLQKGDRDMLFLLAPFAVVALLLLLVIVAGNSSEEETSPTRSTSEASSRPASRPPTPAPRITASELYAEREANATRFDQQRKGTWVRVQGLIGEIDNGQIQLVVDEESFNLIGVAFETVDLNDLPTSVQASVNKGERFAATCKVGDFILGSMQLRDCER